MWHVWVQNVNQVYSKIVSWGMRKVTSNFVYELCNDVLTVHLFIRRTVYISLGPGTSGVIKNSYYLIYEKKILVKNLNVETHVIILSRSPVPSFSPSVRHFCHYTVVGLQRFSSAKRHRKNNFFSPCQHYASVQITFRLYPYLIVVDDSRILFLSRWLLTYFLI